MNSRNIILVIIGVLIFGAILFASSYFGLRNRLVQLNENTKSAWAQVETQLQRRMDLIPNLVRTVKGYAAHEEKVLTEVTKARASVANAGSVEEQINSNNQLTTALSRLMVVVERYPDLKANQNFLALQDELAGTENRIAVARQRYNDAAQIFNSTRLKFPYSLVAAGFKEAPYFKASQGANEAPEVQF